MDLFNKQVFMEVNGNLQIQLNKKQPRWYPVIPTPSSSQSPSDTSYGEEKVVVGIEDTLTGIVDKHTQPRDSGRRIMAISGMGGIGKTTLARKVYENPYIKNYFDVRAWATVSKDYNTKEILVELLLCLDKANTKESMIQSNEHTLGEQLHKRLFGQRYLVIMDDVWDVEAWEKVRSFLPTSKGSGIVITTRESTVASVSSPDIGMRLLDDSKSWDLLCSKIFGNDGCPSELEDVGKNIAKNCRGLPLSVVVIAGHLAKSPRTKEYWKYIAENLSSVVNLEDNERCLKILSLSYAHLPIHLKPCLLYMGIFPEDEEIRVSHLIRLWVAEGFLKPVSGKSPEEIGEDCLNDLVGRNLILDVGRSSLSGRLLRCKIHDLLRDLCVKEAQAKKFFCVLRKKSVDILDLPSEERRVIIHPSAEFYNIIDLKSPPLLRTLMFHGILPSLHYKLLWVLSSVSGPSEIGEQTTFEVTHHLVNLRYIDFWSYQRYECYVIPPSVSLLWNLKYLVISGRREDEAPPEIWEMSQLRHIDIDCLILHLPPIESESNVLKNLMYAQRLLNFSFSKEMLERIPNINNLEVEYADHLNGFDEGEEFALNNIPRLTKLETFSCWCTIADDTKRSRTLRNVSLPQSLKKLTVSHLHWDDVTTKIGSLPLIESLNLSYCTGSEWKLVEGQFRHLKHLEIHWCGDLEYLTADVEHFPCLQSLHLNTMNYLKEISSGVADISTLKEIELRYISDSALASVIEIAEEQYELGNGELQVKAHLFKGQ